MKDRTYKRSLIIISVVLVAGFIALFAEIMHNKRVDAAYNTRIERVISEIKTEEKKSERLDSAKRISAIRTLRTKLERYKKGSEKDTNIIVAYNDAIKNLGKDIRKKNNDEYSKLKTKDINKEIKSTLNEKIDGLNKLSKTLTKQEGDIYSEEEVETFVAKIQRLIKRYKKQIKAINADLKRANADTNTVSSITNADADDVEDTSADTSSEYDGGYSGSGTGSGWTGSGSAGSSSSTSGGSESSSVNTGTDSNESSTSSSAGETKITVPDEDASENIVTDEGPSENTVHDEGESETTVE